MYIIVKEEFYMEIVEFGKENEKKILLIPGNMMSWKQFDEVIPLLMKDYHVIAVSLDGYDGSGTTTFTSTESFAEKLEEYIRNNLNGRIDLAFGESFGVAAAGMLFHRQKVSVGSLIMSGPQYMDLGIFNWFITKSIPKYQYRLLTKMKSGDSLPWLLRVYTHSDEAAMLSMLEKMPPNISLDSLRNAANEALELYKEIDKYEPDRDAHVAIWYGAKEPNMKKALKKLLRAYPNAENHPFEGYGHGDIISHPDIMVSDIRKFLQER